MFGDLPIATKVVIDLLVRQNVELLGVVIGKDSPNSVDPWTDAPALADYAVAAGLRRFTHLEIEESEELIDLGFTCRYSKILSPGLINKFRNGIVNFHGGLLPEMRGLFSSCHSILLGHRVGGGTLHYLDSGVDTGDIIRLAEFEITDDDTSVSIFQKTQQALLDAYLEVIADLLNGTAIRIPQAQLSADRLLNNYFDKHSLEGKKEISLQTPPDEIQRVVRAFDHPHHEPAYMYVAGYKIYLTTQRFFEDNTRK